MSIKKQYLKSKGVCKCTFRLPKAAAPAADLVHIVGDFNDWSNEATPMTRLKSGEFKVELALEPGKQYQFRYLIDQRDWENDWEADSYTPSTAFPAENSVVSV